MEAIIDTPIKKDVTLTDALHRFCARRETRTTIMEPIFLQELASVDQDLIFFVVLDLRKVHDTSDHGWLFKTLEGYGAGPKI